MERRQLVWRGVSVASSALAAGEALLWAVTVAVGVAVFRVVAEKATAAAWTKATGSEPPSTNGDG